MSSWICFYSPFDEIVEKCLQKDPGKRYNCVDGLIIDLEKI